MIADQVPPDNPGAREIGFAVPSIYNASRILFDNLEKGFGDRRAVIARWARGPTRTLRGCLPLGLRPDLAGAQARRSRPDVLDDTPAYPAAFFGAVRAGFVPLLINTLTPPDLLQFYLSDSAATVAIADAEFCSRFDGLLAEHAAFHADRGQRRGGEPCGPDHGDGGVLARRPSDELIEVDTHRNDMAFWMYSSGSTGRPKGIVHLHTTWPIASARSRNPC